MLDLPVTAPSYTDCDICVGPADIALSLPGGTLLGLACWEHRAKLPTPPPSTRRLERRADQWYACELTLEVMLRDFTPEDGLHLECEICGHGAVRLIEQITDDGRWQLVTCRPCTPTTRHAHKGLVQRILAVHERTGWVQVPAETSVAGSASPRG